MKSLRLRSVAAALAACAFIFAGTSETLAGDKKPTGFPTALVTINKTDKLLWVTTYSVLGFAGVGPRKQEDFGHVQVNSRRTWASGTYRTQNSYFVRAQIFTPGVAKEVADTTISLGLVGCPNGQATGVELNVHSYTKYYWRDVGCVPR